MPFYGRYWRNVGGTFENSKNPMWRVAAPLNGDFQGGFLGWRDISTMFRLGDAKFDDGAKAPYIWNPSTKVFFGFENQKSIEEKISVCTKKSFTNLKLLRIYLI